MVNKIFQGTSLENCLQLAGRELNIPENKLKYKVLEDKKIFFKRKVVVEITYGDGEDLKEGEKYKADKNKGTVKIVNGEIIIKDPIEGKSPAVIVKGPHMKVFVDGAEIEKECKVLCSNNVEVVVLEEDEPKRELNICISKDCMEAYAEVNYVCKNVYALKDSEETNVLNLNVYVVKKIEPPEYTLGDIKEELVNNKIIYGIMEENLGSVLQSGKKQLIAKGKESVDGQDDIISINFEDSINLKEDVGGNVDFKSIGVVNTVKKGDVMAELHRGHEGESGFDVKGKTLKFKKGKRKKLKVGKGCIIKDDNKVEAIIEGKPFIKQDTFYVNQVHEINEDVDLSTGNIKFIGDVIVQGNVREDMEIECGGNLIVYKEVEKAKIRSQGDILIKGSIVGSEVYAGGDCVDKIKLLDYFMEFNEHLESLIQAVGEVKTYDLLGNNRQDGEIIKLLLENRYKELLKLGVYIIAYFNKCFEYKENEDKKIIRIISTKLLGMGPINIKNYLELEDLKNEVNCKIENLKENIALPVNLTIAYCQDSHIESSGGILITGEGEYVSEIIANESIEFLQERSVARGGTLKAKKDIKCKIVGSMAGVSTLLQVEDEGHIWADIAYHNTVIKVGKRRIMLDSPVKDLHAYFDKDSIVVDKFLL